MKTIVGLFANLEDADQALHRLNEAGFKKDQISVLARDTAIATDAGDEPTAGEVAGSAGKGAMAGGVVGGVLGVLAGVGAVLIPGLGAAFVAGSLATTLGLAAGGAGVGAAVGGILGAMLELSISEEDAEIYAEAVKRGHILVAVQAAGEDVTLAERIMANANAEDVKNLREQWRAAGWQGYEPVENPDDARRTK